MAKIPPGLQIDHVVAEVCKGGSSTWYDFDKVRLYTNAFITSSGKILLGYKKRGFGQGLWNGFGGKVDPGETFLQAARRELEEEAGITAPLEHRGTIFFKNADIKEAAYIEVFFADEYSGSIIETDEMRPQWFCIDTDANLSDTDPELQPIPFGQMWEDDYIWFPLMLAKRPFAGRVDFGPDGRLRKWWFAEVPAATLIST